jgi:hypothetical protein
MLVRSGITVACRRPIEAPIPFVVTCPSEWHVKVGMGMHPQARDVNFGWRRADEEGLIQSDDFNVNELFLNWFGRTRDEWSQFIHQQGESC